jgi:hypothetical protein
LIAQADIDRVVEAAESLPPASDSYREEDFVMNLFVTVLDYMLQTTVVVAALEHFRKNHWNDVRTVDDLEAVIDRYPEDRDGNVALAVHLWGYRFWTRAQQLRDLVRFFRGVGVVDRETLRSWAHGSEFKRDFAGRVKGLGQAVYQSLLMRQGVDTVKPDVHVRRFAEAAVGRALNDRDVIDVITQAAERLGVHAHELDMRIWTAGSSG